MYKNVPYPKMNSGGHTEAEVSINISSFTHPVILLLHVVEPACGISAGIAKKAVRDWTNRDHKKYWEFLTGLRQAKGFLQRPSVRRTKELLKLNRNQL
jgi:hypothetical protein